MNKELLFITLQNFKSKKKNKEYYKVIMFDAERNKIEDCFITKELYEQIESLELSFGETANVTYTLNAYNQAVISEVE